MVPAAWVDSAVPVVAVGVVAKVAMVTRHSVAVVMVARVRVARAV